MRVITSATAARNPPLQDRFHIEAGLSQFLDCARWISAALVLLSHVNNRATVRLGGTIEGAQLPQIVWGFFCGFGHHAVVVFFVLSGFLVGSNVIRDLASDRFEAGRYLLARISRIHLVLIPALLLTLILDNIGNRLNPDIYAASQQGSFIGNVLMMQGFLTDSYLSDAPLGTLANEFWYYLTFPLLAVGIWKKKIALLALAAVLLVPMTIIQPWHAIGFVLWLIGALVGSIERRKIGRRAQIFGLCFFLLLLVTFRLGIRLEQYTPLMVAITDILVASAFAFVVFSFRSNPVFDLGGFAGVNKAFAGFSYSLYAVHAPIIMLLCALSSQLTGFGWKSPIVTAWQWAIIAGILATTTVAAYLFSLCTEARTEIVRARLDAFRFRILQAWRSGGPAAEG
jgi:peptidoglycan/LPS O-acetylase OafA/YrhL